MDPQKLTSLLRATAATARDRTPACPDEGRLAAYVDGALGPTDAEQLELHLADCEACVALVGFLGRDRTPDVVEPVPDTDLARARQLVTRAPSRWSRLAPPHWAAAAMVLISIAVVTQYSRFSRSGDVGLDAVPVERTTRSASPGKPTLEVLAPGAGATVDAKQLDFRWSAVPGSRYYDVRIVSESGDLLVEQRVAGTEWQPPGQLHLSPGTEYYVLIEAHPSESKTISSDHVQFLVSD
jgi:hypothetical protein